MKRRQRGGAGECTQAGPYCKGIMEKVVKPLIEVSEMPEVETLGAGQTSTSSALQRIAGVLTSVAGQANSPEYLRSAHDVLAYTSRLLTFLLTPPSLVDGTRQYPNVPRPEGEARKVMEGVVLQDTLSALTMLPCQKNQEATPDPVCTKLRSIDDNIGSIVADMKPQLTTALVSTTNPVPAPQAAALASAAPQGVTGPPDRSPDDAPAGYWLALFEAWTAATKASSEIKKVDPVGGNYLLRTLAGAGQALKAQAPGRSVAEIKWGENKGRASPEAYESLLLWGALVHVMLARPANTEEVQGAFDQYMQAKVKSDLSKSLVPTTQLPENTMSIIRLEETGPGMEALRKTLGDAQVTEAVEKVNSFIDGKYGESAVARTAAGVASIVAKTATGVANEVQDAAESALTGATSAAEAATSAVTGAIRGFLGTKTAGAEEKEKEEEEDVKVKGLDDAIEQAKDALGAALKAKREVEDAEREAEGIGSIPELERRVAFLEQQQKLEKSCTKGGACGVLVELGERIGNLPDADSRAIKVLRVLGGQVLVSAALQVADRGTLAEVEKTTSMEWLRCKAILQYWSKLADWFLVGDQYAERPPDMSYQVRQATKEFYLRKEDASLLTDASIKSLQPMTGGEKEAKNATFVEAVGMLTLMIADVKKVLEEAGGTVREQPSVAPSDAYRPYVPTGPRRARGLPQPLSPSSEVDTATGSDTDSEAGADSDSDTGSELGQPGAVAPPEPSTPSAAVAPPESSTPSAAVAPPEPPPPLAAAAAQPPAATTPPPTDAPPAAPPTAPPAPPTASPAPPTAPPAPPTAPPAPPTAPPAPPAAPAVPTEGATTAVEECAGLVRNYCKERLQPESDCNNCASATPPDVDTSAPCKRVKQDDAWDAVRDMVCKPPSEGTQPTLLGVEWLQGLYDTLLQISKPIPENGLGSDPADIAAVRVLNSLSRTLVGWCNLIAHSTGEEKADALKKLMSPLLSSSGLEQMAIPGPAKVVKELEEKEPSMLLVDKALQTGLGKRVWSVMTFWIDDKNRLRAPRPHGTGKSLEGAPLAQSGGGVEWVDWARKLNPQDRSEVNNRLLARKNEWSGLLVLYIGLWVSTASWAIVKAISPQTDSVSLEREMNLAKLVRQWREVGTCARQMGAPGGSTLIGLSDYFTKEWSLRATLSQAEGKTEQAKIIQNAWQGELSQPHPSFCGGGRRQEAKAREAKARLEKLARMFRLGPTGEGQSSADEQVVVQLSEGVNKATEYVNKERSELEVKSPAVPSAPPLSEAKGSDAALPQGEVKEEGDLGISKEVEGTGPVDPGVALKSQDKQDEALQSEAKPVSDHKSESASEDTPETLADVELRADQLRQQLRAAEQKEMEMKKEKIDAEAVKQVQEALAAGKTGEAKKAIDRAQSALGAQSERAGSAPAQGVQLGAPGSPPVAQPVTPPPLRSSSGPEVATVTRDTPGEIDVTASAPGSSGTLAGLKGLIEPDGAGAITVRITAPGGQGAILDPRLADPGYYVRQGAAALQAQIGGPGATDQAEGSSGDGGKAGASGQSGAPGQTGAPGQPGDSSQPSSQAQGSAGAAGMGAAGMGAAGMGAAGMGAAGMGAAGMGADTSMGMGMGMGSGMMMDPSMYGATPSAQSSGPSSDFPRECTGLSDPARTEKCVLKSALKKKLMEEKLKSPPDPAEVARLEKDIKDLDDNKSLSQLYRARLEKALGKANYDALVKQAQSAQGRAGATAQASQVASDAALQARAARATTALGAGVPVPGAVSAVFRAARSSSISSGAQGGVVAGAQGGVVAGAQGGVVAAAGAQAGVAGAQGATSPAALADAAAANAGTPVPGAVKAMFNATKSSTLSSAPISAS